MNDKQIEGLLQRLDERTERMDRYTTQRLERVENELPVLHRRIEKNRDGLAKLSTAVGSAGSAASSSRSTWRTVLEVVALAAAITLGILGIFL